VCHDLGGPARLRERASQRRGSSVATIDDQDFLAAHLSRIVGGDKTVLVISPMRFVADLQHVLASFEDQLREEQRTGGAVRLTFWNQTAALLERPELVPKYVTW